MYIYIYTNIHIDYLQKSEIPVSSLWSFPILDSVDSSASVVPKYRRWAAAHSVAPQCGYARALLHAPGDFEEPRGIGDRLRCQAG